MMQILVYYHLPLSANDISRCVDDCCLPLIADRVVPTASRLAQIQGNVRP